MIHAKEITDPNGKAFLAALRGINTYTAAQVLSHLTPGIDWRGSTKGLMAEAYADAQKSYRGYPQMRRLNLEQLRCVALAKQAGRPEWRHDWKRL